MSKNEEIELEATTDKKLAYTGDDDGQQQDNLTTDDVKVKAASSKTRRSVSLSHVSMMMTNEQAGYTSWFTCPDILFDLNKVTHTGVSNMMAYPKSQCIYSVLGMFSLIGGSFA